MTTGYTKNISLGLLLHNHQPVGNFPWVFEQVYAEAYSPMLTALERHPSVRLSLHYTGSLLDWLIEAHPEFIKRLALLIKRKQVEIVGGGYYEPILPSIPDSDKITQVHRLTEHLQHHFGVRPTGMWLAERVWEPSLPATIRQADIEWTILDDVHFKNVGLDDDDLYGYYATEDQSTPLKIFATSKALRYTIPWRPVNETLETLRSLATLKGERFIVMGDDGEKFGSWPETGLYCWGKDGRSGWVEEFFTALEKNNTWLHTIPLGEYAGQHPALGRIYIPTSSYIEMTEWALPPQKAFLFGKLQHQLEAEKQERILQFMRGGFWRNFLVRYTEINNQHKKMLRVHERVHQAGAEEASGLVHLLKAQSNDTYWHGLFGGIYMAHVRSAIYHHLIKAENLADRQLNQSEHWQRYETTDFDRDTQSEIIIESDQQNIYIDPQRGGSIFEWDIRRSAHNLTSVMTRRLESYHQILREHEQERRRASRTSQNAHQSEDGPGSPHTTVRTKEEGLDQYMVIDRYRRNSLLEHFLPFGLPLESFAQIRYDELGDFIDQPYAADIKQEEHGITVTMTRNGQVQRPGALSPLPVLVEKRLFIPKGEEKLFIRYTVQNLGESQLQTSFASEWNFNLLGGGANEQAYYQVAGHKLANQHFDSTGSIPQVDEFHIGNTWLQQDLGFKLSQQTTLWRFSIETVTGSEAGFERTHQGSCITLLWPLILDAGQSWSIGIECCSQQPSIIN